MTIGQREVPLDLSALLPRGGHMFTCFVMAAIGPQCVTAINKNKKIA
jgi:hypothetical protein